jgi:hypothetical protein
MTWRHAMCTQEVRTMLLFYELLHLLADWQWNDQLLQPPPRRCFKDYFPAGLLARL